MEHARAAITVVIALTLFPALRAGGGALPDSRERGAAPTAAPADLIADPPRDTFLIVPLHVHVLTGGDEGDLDCKQLSDDDIRRVIGKVNRVWHRAGIHFRVASLLREVPVNVDAFGAAREAAAAHGVATPPEALLDVRPPATRDRPGLHVYYVHHLLMNGIYLGGNVCFVKETAALRPVEGGIDEPLPRVTSHEIGHALGLPHRQDTTNLMASGTTGTLLSVAEGEAVRANAGRIDGAMTVAACEDAVKQADADGGCVDRAKELRDALDELPDVTGSSSP